MSLHAFLCRFCLRFCLSLFLWILPVAAFSQVSVNVSTLDPVYRDIDKLVAHGLVDKIIMGQRPFSRREIARITAEALHHLPRLQDPLNDPKTTEAQKRALQARLDYLQPILERLQKDYHEELVQLGALEGDKSWYSAHPVEKVEVDTLLTNSRPVRLPVTNGLGNIDAVINPLVDYRQGRHLIEGFNFSLETSHWVRASNYFAFYVRPRFQLGIAPSDQPNDNNAYVQNLYGKVYIKNFEVEAGRDQIFWGQGQDAGILLSNNPRSFDMFKLSNDSPGILPWIFKYLGAHKLSFFYADLGPEQHFPHSYLAGYKWNFEPLSFLELGASFMLDSGGEGSPEGSFGRRVQELFNYFSEGRKDFSNKVGGLELRFRIPPARRLELYGEAMFDDRHNQFFSHAEFQDTSFITGIYEPRLTNSGNVDLRLEFHKTGDRFYRHPDFASGLTLNQFIIGDNLGSNGKALYLTSNWDIDSRNLVTFAGALEWRESGIWQVGDPIQFNFVKVVDGPTEKRLRGTVAWLHRMKNLPLFFVAQLGYEHAQNFGFTQGATRNNFLGEFNLQINFDRWTHFPR